MLYELCAIPINVGIFLIPLEVLIGLILWIRYRWAKDRAAVNTALNAAAVLILCVSFVGFAFWSNSATTSDILTDFEKYETAQGYFVQTEYRAIKVSQEQYDSLEEGKKYAVVYEHNNWLPDKYLITSVELLTTQE